MYKFRGEKFTVITNPAGKVKPLLNKATVYCTCSISGVIHRPTCNSITISSKLELHLPDTNQPDLLLVVVRLPSVSPKGGKGSAAPLFFPGAPPFFPGVHIKRQYTLNEMYNTQTNSLGFPNPPPPF